MKRKQRYRWGRQAKGPRQVRGRRIARPLEVVAQNGTPLQTGAFKNGKQVGLWKRYYDNGQLWDERGYDDGKKVAGWKVYDKAGALRQGKVFKVKR